MKLRVIKQHKATEFLLQPPTHKVSRIIERLEAMGQIISSQQKSGSTIQGLENKHIRIALYRPLGRLEGEGEDAEAVKEMGPPNSLQYIASTLIQQGHQVRIFDQLAEPYDPASPISYPILKSSEQMAEEIIDWQPHVLMATSFTCQFRQGLTVAGLVKERLGIPIIWGGYHITDVGHQYKLAQALKEHNPEGAQVLEQDMRNIFQHNIVDYVCIGEGIHTASEIINILQGKRNRNDVDSLAFMENDTIVLTPERQRVEMDQYPMLHWPEGYDPMMYYATGRNYPFVLATTMQGCRFKCTFCSTPSSYPGGPKYASIERAIKELENIHQAIGSHWPRPKIMINLTNEDWMANPTYVVEFCNAVRKEGLDKHFEFNSFGTLIDAAKRGKEMLKAMAAVGWSFFFYGIESTINSTARDWKRPDAEVKDRLQMAQQAIYDTSDAGIMPFLDFIAGHPNHTFEQTREDYARLMTLRMVPYVYMPIIAPMPGTPLYWEALWGLKGEGFLPAVTYDQLDANHQVLALRDSGNVKALRDEMVQEFYMRAHYREDADHIIGMHPRTAQFFATMLRKIASDYPKNETLQQLAKVYRING